MMFNFGADFKNPFEIVDTNTSASGSTIKASKPEIEQNCKVALIVDTNVLLKQMHIREMLRVDQQTFDNQFEVITLDRVISEVKDEKSREYILNKLPYQIQVKNAETFLDKQDIDQVQNFAKDTGDFQTLSKVDMMIISLGVKLARQRGEGHLVKHEPKSLDEFKPEHLKEAYDAYSSSSESSDESSQEEQPEDDWEQVDLSRQQKRTLERTKLKQERWAKKILKQQEQEAKLIQKNQVENNPDFDNEVEGGEWITQENLYTYIAHGDTTVLNLIKQDPKPEFPTLEEEYPALGDDDNEDQDQDQEEPQPVAVPVPKLTVTKPKPAVDPSPQKIIFLTSDFAMQNVIIQMGFILLTMDGMRLTRVKRFKLLCRACFRLNLDVERKFCEKCGAHTLNKVSCFINESGKVTFFDNPKRRINLRGTIYSIPKAKGGRNNKDLILREDEFMTGEKMMKLKHIEKEKRKEESAIKNTLEGNYWAGGQGYAAGVSSLLYENGAKGGTKGKNNNDFKIGYGKKNPNISRRKV